MWILNGTCEYLWHMWILNDTCEYEMAYVNMK